jgi:hypothetical protein
MALQHWLGLLSQWRPGIGSFNTHYLAVARPHLAGAWVGLSAIGPDAPNGIKAARMR